MAILFLITQFQFELPTTLSTLFQQKIDRNCILGLELQLEHLTRRGHDLQSIYIANYNLCLQIAQLLIAITLTLIQSVYIIIIPKKITTGTSTRKYHGN